MQNFQKINKNEFINFYNQALFKTFFHSSEWHEFLEKEFKWLKFEYYLYKDEAFLPFVRFKVFGKEKLISLPFCEYGGPLPLKKEIDFENFKKDIFDLFGESIKIKFHPQILSFLDIKPQKEEGLFSDTVSYQIVDLDKKTEQGLFQSFRLSTKQRIKKGLNENLSVSKCESNEDLNKFYAVYIKSMKRNKTVCFPAQIFEFLWQKSLESDLVDFLIVKHEERVIAGIIIVFYAGIAHYFLSGMDYKYIKRNKLNPMYLVLWKEIKKIINSKKANVFDFGGTKRETGLEEFKRGWDPECYPIFKLEAGETTQQRLRESKLRDVWGLLPDFIVKIVSPHIIKYRL